VLVVILAKEAGFDLKNAVKREAADVDYRGYRRVAEMHRLNGCTWIDPQQPAAQALQLVGANELRLAQKDAIGEPHLLLRLVKIVELLRRMLGIDYGHNGVQGIVRGNVIIDKEGLRNRRRIGEPGRLDDDAIEGLGFCLAALT